MAFSYVARQLATMLKAACSYVARQLATMLQGNIIFNRGFKPQYLVVHFLILVKG